MLVTRQIADNLKEIFLPLGQTRIQQVYLSLRADGFPTMKKEFPSTSGQQNANDTPVTRKPSETRITRAEQEEIKPKA